MRFRITNPYTPYGRIANPSEQGMLSAYRQKSFYNSHKRSEFTSIFTSFYNFRNFSYLLIQVP